MNAKTLKRLRKTVRRMASHLDVRELVASSRAINRWFPTVVNRPSTQRAIYRACKKQHALAA